MCQMYQMFFSWQGGMGNIHPSASMSLLGQALSNQEMVERISNKPEEAIDLDDN